MERLEIDPRILSRVFISHAHWDHTGGLAAVLDRNREAVVYLPASCPQPAEAGNVQSVQGICQITPQLMSTGELQGGEQALVVDTGHGLAVVCGCAHPGVVAILKAAARFGRVTALIGGLHGFRDFDLLEDLSLICLCHCTQNIDEIKQRYPQTSIPGGAGKILQV